MEIYRQYSAELRHMPRQESRPYLFVSNGEEEIFIFEPHLMLDPKNWQGSEYDDSDTIHWSTAKWWLSTSVVWGKAGFYFAQEDRSATRSRSFSVEITVPSADLKLFWSMLKTAAAIPAKLHPQILT